jgi:regulation of enolase protein 1 (concanavalin A-like superfamily)
MCIRFDLELLGKALQMHRKSRPFRRPSVRKASTKWSVPCLVFSLIFLTGFAFSPSTQAQTNMTVSSLSGPVTSTEINSFVSYVTAQAPATNNIGNNWAQGTQGEEVKAMGLVYEITQNTAILDQMIRFCDAVLSERNDLAPAPTGQIVIWTGSVDPVWPNTTTTPIGTGGEQGDPVGHLGNCARLILQSPSIWSNTVAIGDPDGYGTTYLARANTYVQGGDTAISGHILKSELDLSNSNHFYFASGDPYKGGTPVPWNQVMMFTYAFQNLATAHDLLGDNPALAAQYHQLVQDNINWFFSSGVTTYTDSAGNTAYSWGYAMPATTKEDNDHGSLDVNGFYRAYMTGEYGITPAMMTPFGNTFEDVMTLGAGDYSGVIDGTTGSGNSASTDYIRSGWLLTADFLPGDYATMVGADFTAGGTTTNADRFSKLLWLKNKGYQSFSFGASPASQTVATGSNTTYTATVTAQGSFSSTVGLSVAGLPTGATASFSPAAITGGGSSTLTVTTASSTPAGTYSLTISAFCMGAVTQTAAVTLVVEPGAATPTFSPGGGTYSSAQSVTISTATSGASIRYTTDGSTPTETHGTVYSSPVSIGATTTLQALAYKSGDVDSPVSSAVYTISAGSLPSGWTDSDIGGPGVAGSASYSAGTFTVLGSGTDIYGTADQFNYASQSVSGNLTITALVNTQTNTNSWAKAGVMIRESTAAGAAYVGVYITPGKGASLQYRPSDNATAVNGPETTGLVAPYWLQLVRNGSTFTASISPDGVTWTVLGTETATMSTAATAGLAVCSHNNTALSTATFSNISVNVLPTSWTDLDIGAPGVTGSANYSGTTFTVSGSGADIYGTADQFHYVYQTTSSTSVSITARVATQTDTNVWAKAGVMIRASTAAGSTYVGIYITPGKGASLQYRSTTNASAINVPNVTGPVAPYWVRLTRSGSTFTAYTSTNGTTWTTVGSETVTMATDATLGLAVCSHDNTQLSTAIFDNVTP